MKKYVFLHYGFTEPTPEIMEAWGKWFASLGDKIVDPGAPSVLEEKSLVPEPKNCPWEWSH